MHRPFPDKPAFTGFNQPRRIEADIFDLEIEGELPAALDGAFYRCGPDPRFAPILGDDININGDGMVTMFRFRQGDADFRSRYVHTEKYRLETAARRALFGAYRNPYTDDISVAGKDRTTANTNAVFHGGRLLALKEDGLPHQIDPETLATRGKLDFGGKLRSLTFTAHPKIDPATGEMVSFGYEAAGLATREMSLQCFDAAGNLTREELFLAPYVSFQHDFAVASEHIVFLLMPCTSDDARMRAGGAHWLFEPGRNCEIGVMRRDAGVESLRWFSLPGRGIGHILNAFSDGDKVHVDLFISERNQFPFIANADGSGFDRDKSTPRLTRWSFDLGKSDGGFAAERLFPDFMEMPTTDDRYQMFPYRYGYCTIMDPEQPLNVAGTIGLAWNTIAAVDVSTRTMKRYYVGDRTACQEPRFVPRSPDAPEGDGYLLSVVTRYDDDPHTELLVLDATCIDEGPVAVVKLPLRLRGAVHGNWVSEAALARAV
ncbi:MAG TPA: carotenoid oxygenase family protein [Sphingomonadaceae bacterium]|nr:carotenoid oxygenase family protein [Sphingomonadaceae bacterium]